MSLTIPKLAVELQGILRKNAPERTNPASGPYGDSPYPGNLRQNAINIENLSETTFKIVVGGAPAPYGPRTERTSFKKGWMAKSKREFAELLVFRYGGRIE